MANYDFSGWATRNDLLCSDGVTIRKDAFKDMDGKQVPLVYGHDHEDPSAIIGYADLENKPEGIYMRASFNNSDKAQYAKEGVAHGDIKHLSIYATHVKKVAGNVVGGIIKEVSLVPFGGANPGAFIDQAVIAHSDGTYSESEDEAVIFLGDYGEIERLEHQDKEDEEVADENKKPEEKTRTVEDVLNEMNEEQLAVVEYLIENAKKGDKDDEVEHSDEDDGGEEMKYNAFEDNGSARRSNVISHADQKLILENAKRENVGSFKLALQNYMEENGILQHDDDPVTETAAPVAGFITTDNIGDGRSSFEAMLPEFREVRPGMPEIINYDTTWVGTVMTKTHKSPIARIRTTFNDIRAVETESNSLRGKGYQKGAAKKYTGNLNLVRRTTEPQTVYVKSALHRDDILDMYEFDYVQYLYGIDLAQLKEEVATAVLIGDGRDVADEDKIFPDKIRPIWTDDELYVIHKDLDLEAMQEELQGTDTEQYFGSNFIKSESMVNTILYALESYRGSGNPDMFIHPHYLNMMLLARDRDGHRIYSSKGELATSLNVGSIHNVEKFKDLTRTVTINSVEHTKKLVCILVNLADYTLGSAKGGQITHFTDFDLKFNQNISLLETRLSGALTRVSSAIVIEEDITA